MWCYTVEKTGKELLNRTIQRPVSCVNRGGKAEWFSRSGLVFAAWKGVKSRMENKENVTRNDLSYEEIMDKLKESYPFERLMSRYRCAMMEIETKFNVLNEEYSLLFDRQPISSIKARLKSPESIIEKMRKLGKPFTLKSMEENLNDIAGIRVVCSFVSDVYTLAEALLKQDDITLIQRKDYIAGPKGNGYRSLHLIVEVPIFLEREKRIMKAEVQLRTIAMDSWASLEHQLRYKKENLFDEQMMQELRTCADLSAELDAKMNHLKSQVDHQSPQKQ